MPKHGLTERQLKIVHDILVPYAGKIERVGLFGSRATGTARANSDIDLVLYGELDEALVDRIWTLFNESLLPFTVDVQAYNLVKYPPLKNHIDNNMQPLFNRQDLLKEATT